MIGDTGSLMASYIQLHSHGNIHTAAGAEITSLMKHECNIHEHNHLFSCIPRHTLDADITEQSFVSHFNKRFKADIQSVEDALQVLSQNYTVYIVSFDSIDLTNATVHGSRIGLCAPRINLTHTKLDAAERGCPSGNGLGHGEGSSQCPGAGGSHGGHGGIGSIGHNDAICKKLIAKPYFYEGEAKYEGSAGGRGNQTQGGAGGGIIWMASTGTISLNNSHLNVTGQNGHAGQKGHFGSGGGAGGSIQIITKNIAGNNTELDLSGGHGSIGGGGGGSGGRFVNYFLHGFNATGSA